MSLCAELILACKVATLVYNATTSTVIAFNASPTLMGLVELFIKIVSEYRILQFKLLKQVNVGGLLSNPKILIYY